MGRFDHLEMGDWPTGNHEPDPNYSGLIDQHYYMDKAEDVFSQENYERALAFYSRALQYDIDLEEAWLGQIRCLIELSELPEAITWSDRALQRFPNSPEVLSARGVAESRLGRQIAAIGYSDAAFNSQKVTPYMWIARGEVLIPRNAVNAKACFMKAVEMASSDWRVRAWIARSYLVRGCHHQALEHLRHAVRLDPDRHTCWYWIGKCCESMGEINEAKLAYGRALAAQPAFTRARDALVNVDNQGAMSKVGCAFKRLFKRGLVSEG